MLCQRNGRHCGLFLTRDRMGKDPQRPRYFVGRSYYTGSSIGSAGYLSRMCDLGEDLRHLTFNGKPVNAAWRTVYVVPTPSDLDSMSSPGPDLLINCNSPSGSRFHLPRWLVDRFTTLQFEVDQMVNSQELHVVRFAHRSEGRIFVSLGSCGQHHDADNRPLLWAKVDLMSLSTPKRFVHNCSEDHIDSNSKFFGSGDADRNVRLSFMPSRTGTGLDMTLIIHLELFGRVFKKMLKEAGISFPSLADLRKNAPGHAAPDAPVTSSQLHSTPRVEPSLFTTIRRKRFARADLRRGNSPVPKRSFDVSSPSPPLFSELQEDHKEVQFREFGMTLLSREPVLRPHAAATPLPPSPPLPPPFHPPPRRHRAAPVAQAYPRGWPTQVYPGVWPAWQVYYPGGWPAWQVYPGGWPTLAQTHPRATDISADVATNTAMRPEGGRWPGYHADR